MRFQKQPNKRALGRFELLSQLFSKAVDFKSHLASGSFPLILTAAQGIKAPWQNQPKISLVRNVRLPIPNGLGAATTVANGTPFLKTKASVLDLRPSH
jgi:hypothetical protein